MARPRKYQVGYDGHQKATRRMRKELTAYDVPTQAQQKRNEKNARQRAYYTRRKTEDAYPIINHPLKAGKRLRVNSGVFWEAVDRIDRGYTGTIHDQETFDQMKEWAQLDRGNLEKFRQGREERKQRRRVAVENITDLDERGERLVEDFFDNPEPAPRPHPTEDAVHSRWDMVRDKILELDLDPRKMYHYQLDMQVDVGKVKKNGEMVPIDLSKRVQTEYDFARNVLGSELEDHVLDFLTHWGGDGYSVWEIETFNIEVTEVEPTSVKTQKARVRDQLHEKRRDVGAPILPIRGVSQNQTDDGTCGIALAKSCGVTQRTLTAMWKKAEEGISIADIQDIAEKEGRSHVVLDVNGKVLFKKTARSDDRRHRKSICYYAIGRHFYPIVDDATRQALGTEPDTVDICSECGTETPFNIVSDFCDACGGELDISKRLIASRKKVMGMGTVNPGSVHHLYYEVDKVVEKLSADEALAISEEAVGGDEELAVVVTGQALEDLICSIYEEKNTLVPSKTIRVSKLSFFEDGKVRRRIGVASFKMDNVVFQYNPHIKEVQVACKALNIPYNGQTPMILLLDLFRYSFPDAACTTNAWTEGWFTNTHLALNQVFRTSDSYDADHVAAYDCARSYENSCRRKKLPWAVFHSADYPTKYDGGANPIANLLPGVYYVRFFGDQPLWLQMVAVQFPDGYYYHEFIRFLYQWGVSFEILEQIIAQTTLPANSLKMVFDRIYQALPDELAKGTCREFIGMLNKRNHRMYKAAYSPNVKDLEHSFHCRGPIQAVKGLHRGLTYDDYHRTESYVPIYQQAIEQGWINVLQLAACVNPEKWLMIKTDELVVEKEHDFLEDVAKTSGVKYTVENIDEAKADRLS